MERIEAYVDADAHTCFNGDEFITDMKDSKRMVVDIKKGLVVALFFLYTIYVICAAANHCFRQSKWWYYQIVSVKFQKL